MAPYQTTAVPSRVKVLFVLSLLALTSFIIAYIMLIGHYSAANFLFNKPREMSPQTLRIKEKIAAWMQQTTEVNGSAKVNQVRKDGDILGLNKSFMLKKTVSSSTKGNDVSLMASVPKLCPGRYKRHYSIVTDRNITAVKYVPTNSDEIIKKTFTDLNVEEKDRFCSILEQFERSLGKEYSILSKGARYAISVSILARLGYEQRLPNVIGLGVKKTGSTALLHFMKFHPNIRTADKEIHFFNRDKEYRKGIIYYRAKMKFSKQDDVVYEKSPGYFNESSVVPKRIKMSLLPTVKFILGVREPVERTISDFHHTSFIHGVKGISRSECTSISEGKRFVEILFDENDNVKVNHPFINTSSYAYHFRPWLEYFPRSNFFVFDEKEMKNSPFKVLKKLEGFLGIDSFFRSDMFIVQNGKSCFKTERTTYCPSEWGKTFPKPEVEKTYISKLQNYFMPLNKEFEILVDQHFEW